MQRLALDVDALVHARRPGLIPEIEALIGALPDRAYIERSVYHHDAARSGLLPVLEDWQSRELLRAPVDYRGLHEGDRRFRAIGARREWKRLSPQDRATLVTALALEDCAVLTCERPLTSAVEEYGLIALDLFDIVRYGIQAGRLTVARAKEMCAEWDRNRFSAGRPSGYRGFDAERSHRDGSKPLRI